MTSVAEQVEADKAKWPQLLANTPDGPDFDFDNAAVWMAQVSGETP
jgi:hypothetical protein